MPRISTYAPFLLALPLATSVTIRDTTLFTDCLNNITCADDFVLNDQGLTGTIPPELGYFGVTRMCG